jgi:hypothetical protein
MPIPINLTTQFSNSSSERKEIECDEHTGDGCSAVDEFNTIKYHSKCMMVYLIIKRGPAQLAFPNEISPSRIEVIESFWCRKMGHSLIVTVVPVSRLKVKLFLAGTVKPLIVIVVHLTASATSEDVRTIPTIEQQPWHT